MKSRMLRNGIVSLTCYLAGTLCFGQLFGPVHTLCEDCTLPFLADADADNDPDAWMVIGDSLVLAVNDSGTFANAQYLYAIAAGSSIIEAIDMDGDGDIDPLLRDAQGGTAMMLRDTGPGYTAESLFIGGTTVRVADIQQDGLSEVLVRDASEEYRYRVCSIQVVGFELDTVQIVGWGTLFGFYKPFDWDHDGDLDVLGCLGLNCNLSVAYTVDGSLGSIFVQVSSLFGGGPGSGNSIITDLNGDGLQDLVAGLNAYLAQESGDFVGHSGLYSVVMAGEMDCDASTELVGVSFIWDSRMMVVKDITVLGIADRSVEFAPEDGDYDITIADIDADGRSDVVYMPMDGTTVFWRRNMAGEDLDVTLDLPVSVPGDTVMALDGGSPAGGYYAGQGVYDGVLWAQLVEEGATTITYHYYDTISGCEAEASQTITIEDDIGISEEMQVRLSCWPVPVSDLLHVRIDGARMIGLRLIDAWGRPVRDMVPAPFTVARIDVTGLVSGPYFLETVTVQGVARRTVLVGPR